MRPHLTQLSGELGRAVTREALWRWEALATVLARPAGARIPLELTERAREARRAQAAVALRTLLQNTGRD